MVFLAYVAVTGLLLGIDNVTAPDLGPRPGRAPAATATLPVASLEGWAAKAAHAALGAAGRTPASVDLNIALTDSAPQVAVNLGDGKVSQYDANTGALLAVSADQPPAGPALSDYALMRIRLHDLLQDIHRGSIFGVPGQLIDVLTGVSFLILSFTGIVMYFQMLVKRRNLGRQGAFWQ